MPIKKSMKNILSATRAERIVVFTLFFFWLFSGQSYAQAIDQLGLKKGVSTTGSVNINTTSYSAQGIEARRNPFIWYLNGNLNINLFGFSLPFSFNYSNQQTTYSQPFNQFRFAPSYKWAKLYVGNTSMTFSNYTLAGHVFNGVGTELSPGKWKMAAMYGTLLRASPFDVAVPESYNHASFERKGYGVKAAYDDKGNSYGMTVFRAKDEASSIPFIPDDATLSPQENRAIAGTVKQNITQRIFAEAEYSLSFLTRDTRSLEDSTRQKNTDIKSTENVQQFGAIQAGLGYRGDFYTLQLRYERVDPGYTTLGAYNVINDMRNITVAPSAQLFSGKVNVAANAGVQKNNLDNSKASSTQRLVGSLNVSFAPNEKWSVNGGYSNFSNYTRVRPQVDPYFKNPLDTLDFYQVNNSYNATMTHSLSNDKNKQQTITLNTSYQHASDKSSAKEAEPSLSQFFTSLISYSYNLVPQSLAVTGSLNYNQNNASGLATTFFGPTMNVSKLFYDKTVRTAITTTYNSTVTFSEKSTNSSLFSTSLNAGYTPKAKKTESDKKKIINAPKHNVGSTLLFLRRGATAQPAYSEITFMVNYTCSF